MIGLTGTTGVTIGAKQVADAAERSAVVIAYGVTTLDDALLVGFRLSVAGRSRRKGPRFASRLVSNDEVHIITPFRANFEVILLDIGAFCKHKLDETFNILNTFVFVGRLENVGIVDKIERHNFVVNGFY